MATTKINAAQIVGTAGSPGASEVVKLDSSSNVSELGSITGSGDLFVSGSVTFKSNIYGDGSSLTGISADAIDVTASATDHNMPLVFTSRAQSDGSSGLALSSSLHYNPSTNLLTTPGAVTAAGVVTATGRLICDNATDASNKTDGSLQTDGGLSVAKAIYNGTAATLAADSGVVTMGAATAATVSAAGIINVNNETDATSGTDGSLQTDGGLSVAKAAYIGTDLVVADDATLKSDSAVLGFGADTDVTLTHVADTGLLLNGSSQLQFRDSAIYISSSVDGFLDLTADTKINLSGAVGISGLTTFQTGLVPDADDGAYLGTSALGWSDLFLAEGGVINWDNGDMTMTQASNVMTIAGGTLTATLTNAMTNGTNGGIATLSYNGSAADTVELDLDDLTAADVSVANDSIAIIDANDSSATRKESISDLVDAQAGNGLQGGSGQFYVTWSSSVFGRARGNVSNGSADGSASGSSFLSCSVSSSTALGTRPQVYLNGLLQVQGSGSNALADSARDYAAYASGSNTVVLFKSEIDTDDVVLVRYIEN